MFFSHTSRIWLTYAAILVLLVSVLAWFSWFALCLDQQAQQNRQAIVRAEQEAAQQERISRALWRMDWALSPLVAQEAARTHWMYQSFLNDPVDSSQTPSPLLMRPSAWVLLHFQVNQADEISSPQAPEGANRQYALRCGVSEGELQGNCRRLEEISGKIKFEPLWQACSTTMLAQTAGSSLTWLPSATGIGNFGGLSELTPGGNFNNAVLPQQELLVDNGSNQAAEQQSQVIPPQQRSASKSQAVEYLQRGQTTNNLALGQWQANRINNPFGKGTSTPTVTEGALRPVWFDDRLVLIRRVESPDGQQVQGCWLDWPAIKVSLLQEISDIIPDADLLPRNESDEHFGRALATLPVDLLAPPLGSSQEIVGVGGPGMSSALLIAWSGLLIAAVSTGWLILAVTKLSERRAAFASAVTHELRTPLTTFRLYSEMLASNIVSDETQRQTYTSGLVRESDRLCRLVENVLQFARLEQKRPVLNSTKTSIDQLLSTIVQRCTARAETSAMKLELIIPDGLRQREIVTSPDYVDQILFNLVDNACKYASDSARQEVCVEVVAEAKWLVISVRDFGSGIDASMVKRLFQPFSRSADETAGTAAGVGLGLSLSRQLAKQLGGRLDFGPANPGSIFQLRLRN